MKRVMVDWQGKAIWGWTENINGTIWAHVDGRTFARKAEDDDILSSGDAVGDPNKILAPMPGKITKVAKSNNSNVESGEVVVVMEAMKMEYSLQAAQAGKITDILCKEGDHVDLGQILVQLEEAK